MSRNEKRKNVEMQSFFSNLKLLFFSKRIHKLHFATSKRIPNEGIPVAPKETKTILCYLCRGYPTKGFAA